MIFEYISGIISTIHDVDFGETTNRALPTWVNFPHDFEGLAYCKVLIGRDDAKDDGTGFGYIPQSHIFGDFVDVVWLFTDRDGGNTWQIDDGEVWARLREDIEDDGLVNDLLAFATDLVSDEVYACSDFIEVGELLLGALL